MRISDWSSDVCSSDLPEVFRFDMAPRRKMPFEGTAQMALRPPGGCGRAGDAAAPAPQEAAVGQQAEVVQQAAGIGAHHRAGPALRRPFGRTERRSEEHPSELQSLMRNSYAVFCL